MPSSSAAVLHWRGNTSPGLTFTDVTGRGNDLTPSTAPAVDTGARTWIGRNADDGSQACDGGVDAFGVFSDVLTAGEISDLYNAGSGREHPFTGATNEATLLSKCVCFLKLEETGASDRQDETASNLDFSATNSPSSRSGKIGSACDFNGSNQQIFRAPYDAALAGGNRSFSVSLWALMDTKTPPSGGSVISFAGRWDRVNHDCPEWVIYYHTTSDTFQVDYGSGDDSLVNNGVVISKAFYDAVGTPSTGTWYHLVMVYDSSTSTLSLTVNKDYTNTLTPVAQPALIAGPIASDVYGATVAKGALYTVASRISGYDIDGPHYLGRANTTDLNGGNQVWSLTFWLKITSLATTRRQHVMGKYVVSGTVIDWLVWWKGDTGFLEWQISDGGGSNFAVSTVAIADTNWHFYHAWVDRPNTQIGLSKDNATHDTDTLSFDPASTSTAFRIGTPTGATDSTNQLDASLASITKWDHKLSAQELSDLYAAGAGLAYPFTAAGGGQLMMTGCGR